MAAAEIALTAGMRANLNSLSVTGNKINRTQERLATGKKINESLDNPTNYFAARSHYDRAQDLEQRKSRIFESVQTVKATSTGISCLIALIESAKGSADAALATADENERKAHCDIYNTLLKQIDYVAYDSHYNGINLLVPNSSGSLNSMMVEFGQKFGDSNMIVNGIDATSDGLGLYGSDNGVGNISEIYLVIRFDPQFDSNGDVNNDGIVGEGEGTEIDFKLVNNNSYTAKNVSFKNAKTSMPWSFHSNTYANFGNVAAGQTVITNTGTDLDLNFPLGTNGTDFFITLDFTSDGKTRNLSFGPFTVGALTNGQTFPAIGYQAKANEVSWNSNDDILESADRLDVALATLRAGEARLSSELSVIVARQDFIVDMVNILVTGAENLTLADMTEESANLLMLQTMQELGITSLSMSSRINQSVMNMFLS